MEEDFNIENFIDQEEDLEHLSIFIPDELKLDSDEDDLDPEFSRKFEDLSRSKLNILVVVDRHTNKISKETKMFITESTSPPSLTSDWIANWYDYFTTEENKCCNEVSLFLNYDDLSSYATTEVIELELLRNHIKADYRKIYSSLINRIL